MTKKSGTSGEDCVVYTAKEIKLLGGYIVVFLREVTNEQGRGTNEMLYEAKL